MQKFTQLIAEAVIPILGFYYWDWSWYFILLFYILDVMAREVILNLQAKKIYETQGGENTRTTWLKSSAKSAVIGLFTLALLHVMQFIRYPDFSVPNEIMGFLGHKEMGIAQGLILIPLVCLNVWMLYKMNFLKLNLQVKTRMSIMWSEHIRYRNFVLLFAGVGLAVATVFGLKENVLLWSAVLLPFLYVQFFKKEV